METRIKSEIYREAHKIMENRPKVCANCGNTETLEIHHIVPVSQNGSNNEGNLVYLCNECHRKAHGRVMSAADDGILISRKDYDAVRNNLKDASREDLLIILSEIKGKGYFKIVNSRIISPHMEEWQEREAKCMKIFRPWEFKKLYEYIQKLNDSDKSVISESEILTSAVHEKSHEIGLPPQKILDILTEAIKNDQTEIDWENYG